MTDQSDMAVFVKIVEQGSMSKAGREMRLTPGAVTKRMVKLETRLGVRLMNRSTRRITLTEAGHEFYEKAQKILSEIYSLESSLSTFTDSPRGMLKISSPSLFGRKQLSRLLLEFSQIYPDIHVHLQLTDRNVNLISEGIDLAIRNFVELDSSLVVRRLAPDRRVVCGAPNYFKKNGVPQKPEDLLQHNCLMLRFPGSKQYRWHFLEGDEYLSYLVKGMLDSNSTEVLREWALAGVGVSVFSTADIADDLRENRLQAVLTDFQRQEYSYNIIFPKRELLPQKTRVFVDFLTSKIGKLPAWDQSLGF